MIIKLLCGKHRLAVVLVQVQAMAFELHMAEPGTVNSNRTMCAFTPIHAQLSALSWHSTLR